MLAAGALTIPNPFPEKSVATRTLSNGLRLVVREDHSLPVVSMVVVVRGGSSALANSRGAAHYVEHLVFQGSRLHPAPLSAQYALEAAGGISTGVTTRDMSRFQAVMPSTDAELMVTTLADITLHPLLTEEAFARERPVILAEVQRAGDQLLTPAINGAYLLTYAKHPYKHLPTGTLNDVLTLTYDDVRAFHAQWYAPNNMSVVVVGDITTDRAVALVKKSFGSAPSVKLPDPPTAEPERPTDTARAHFPRAANGTYQVLAFAAPGAKSYQAMVATDVLTALLADGPEDTLSSRWSRDGLETPDFGIEFVSMRDAGRCFIWAKSTPQLAKRVRESTLSLLADLRRDGIPPAAVEDAKQRLAAQFLLENETYSQQAASLAFYEALGGAELACRYLPAVAAMTPDDVRRVVPEPLLGWITVGDSVEETP